MFHNNTVINGEMWFSHSFFINTVRLFPMDKYLVFLLYNQSKHYRFIFPQRCKKNLLPFTEWKMSFKTPWYTYYLTIYIWKEEIFIKQQ